MIAIEDIQDTACFEAMRDEWNELLKSSACDCLFLTWEWLYTWWKYLREDRRLHIVAVRRGAELIAIAPLALIPQGSFNPRLVPLQSFKVPTR